MCGPLVDLAAFHQILVELIVEHPMEIATRQPNIAQLAVAHHVEFSERTGILAPARTVSECAASRGAGRLSVEAPPSATGRVVLLATSKCVLTCGSRPAFLVTRV